MALITHLSGLDALLKTVPTVHWDLSALLSASVPTWQLRTCKLHIERLQPESILRTFCCEVPMLTSATLHYIFAIQFFGAVCFPLYNTGDKVCNMLYFWWTASYVYGLVNWLKSNNILPGYAIEQPLKRNSFLLCFVCQNHTMREKQENKKQSSSGACPAIVFFLNKVAILVTTSCLLNYEIYLV